MSVGSFIDAVCSSNLFVIYTAAYSLAYGSRFFLSYCCVLVHIASVVTKHITSTMYWHDKKPTTVGTILDTC